MGFNFKGLTSAALVARSEQTASATNKDIADVPASVLGHTSSNDAPNNVDEKLGGPHDAKAAGESSDEESVDKIDVKAEKGVMQAQGMTLVWTRNEIILAYVK